ncbi:MAG TPA: tetratricopeptide repeat protein [Chthonomonadaceae bacterium]|nr:tetratricopeptide repeat protein [Chthonomonadaceae bacterium]
MPADVFISYSSKDATVAQAVCAAIEAKGPRCWIAPRDIQHGVEWSAAIIDGIHAAKAMVLVFSANSNESPQVLREVERAVSQRIPLLPFRLENVSLSKPMEYFISVPHWFDALTQPLEPHLEHLAESVHRLLTKPEEAAALTLREPTPIAPTEPPHNLPRQLTTFVGREKQVEDVKKLVASKPLTTLVGMGGCGKTRLALHVGNQVLNEHKDGVWFVELAPLSDPNLVPQTVASEFDVREEPGRSVTQTLIDHLKSKKTLLLLDNCEHVLSACSTLTHALLRACPQLRVLASSREVLSVQGEAVYHVPTLSLPPKRWKPGENLEEIMQYEAVHLFVERARLARPDFTLTEQNALALVQLCHQLDGIPLALELAAARIKSLSVEEIVARLDNRFRLLTGGSKTAPAKNQTLRAMIDWSYDLLTEPERTLFRRLSVFAGGWTLAAAEAVCVGDDVEDWEVLDLLTQLVDKSLVIAEEDEGTSRYRTLETVRQYGREKLAETNEYDTIRSRQRDFFLAFAEEAVEKLKGAEMGDWLDRVEEENDNLRAALNWSLDPSQSDKDTALRLAVALARFWMVRGYLSEGRQWLTDALGTGGAKEPTKLRARALNNAGILAWSQRDYSSVAILQEECLGIREKIGDTQGMANSLNNLGIVAAEQGDYTVAQTLYEQALEIKRSMGDKTGIADSLNSLGVVVYEQGDYKAARTYHEEALKLRRELNNPSRVTISLNNLAMVNQYQGDYATAQALYEESLGISRELEDKAGIATCLNYLGILAIEQGDTTTAEQNSSEALTLLYELGDKQGIADALNTLGKVAFVCKDVNKARSQFAGSLLLFQEIGDKPGLVEVMEKMARLAWSKGQGEQAAKLFGFAAKQRETMGLPLTPAELQELAVDIEAAEKALGTAAFGAAWEAGSAFDIELAVTEALKD